MKKLIVLILFMATFCNAQEDNAFVTFGFLRKVGIFKSDSGIGYLSPTMTSKTIGDTALAVLQRVPQGTTGSPDTVNLLLSKQNAGDNFTKLSDPRLSDMRVPRSHNHPESDITSLTTDLSGKEPVNSNIQSHISSAHAPSNAQKNSDITKAEIEAKLTGEISTHTHAGGSGLNYTVNVQALTSSPTDAQTVYFGMLPKAPTTTANISKVYIRKAGTIKIAEIYCYSGTAGTNEAWSLYIRKNNTTDYLIATLSLATSERVFSNTGLSIAVAIGDYIEIKGIQPTWGTNPLTTIYGGYFYVE
jgi:hypothetical protein